MAQDFVLRKATREDSPEITALINASVRELSKDFYSEAQIEGALISVFGVDTQLIDDGTYYVVEGDTDAGRRIVAAGGWSARRTLFGGDQMKETADPALDSTSEAARIRAFFVHPAAARRGLARRLYNECESAARTAGFRAFQLMATLPGQPLYRALGFVEEEELSWPIAGGELLDMVRMRRVIT